MEKVSAEQLFESFTNYIIVDLRDLRSFQLYRIPFSYSFNQCYEHVEKVKKSICFVCCDGKESKHQTKQFTNSVYLEGGLKEWIKHDYDVLILKQYSNRELCEDECCNY